MKQLNKILITILALMLIFILIFHFTGKLKANVSCTSAPASEHADSFNSVIEILKTGSAPLIFNDEMPESDTNLYLMSATIELKNIGFCDAEWLEADVNGASGDIAVYSLSGTECDIHSGSTGQIILKLLTRTPDEKRDVCIRYFILGKQRSVNLSI